MAPSPDGVEFVERGYYDEREEKTVSVMVERLDLEGIVGK